MSKTETLKKIATRLRIHSLKMTTRAGSGHPTTCLSMADLAACLFFSEMRYNPADPEDWGNDEFVLSKGHAAPILWAAYAEAGIIPLERLLGLRKIDSDLEGHPTPRMPWVKSATGSLGQGLAVGAGMALAMKMGKSAGRVFVVMGDGECAEGAVWEAANAAALFGLTNLRAIVDVNRLGQSDFTMHQHDISAYERKFRAFGWETVRVDGHDIKKILEAFDKIRRLKAPVAVLARTLKGKGVSFIQDKNGWHGKPLKPEELEAALKELGPMPEVVSAEYVRKPRKTIKPALLADNDFPRTDYREKTATRLAYGIGLAALGKTNQSVVVLDGDVKNSTYADRFFEAFPGRSFQAYIAEQLMAGMGIGLSAKGRLPFIATFAAFLTRAHDQVRMAAYSFANVKFCGSHVGVSIGEDGPSQMGLEDLALFRSVPGCLVLYPSDAFAAEGCLRTMAGHKGLAYLRTSRPATPLLYSKSEEFPAGGSKVLKKTPQDRVTVIGAGITVHEALKAHESLKKEGIDIRVLDAYSVEPLDAAGILREAQETGGRVIVVEDHFQAGGVGEAVSAALSGKARVVHLCVRALPRSGKPDELLDAYGISSRHIQGAVKSLMRTDLPSFS